MKAKNMAMQDQAPMNEKMVEEKKRQAMYGYNESGAPFLSEDQMKAKNMASQDQGVMNEKMVEEKKRQEMYGYNAKQLDAQALRNIVFQGKRENYRPESSNVPVGYSRGD